MTQRLYLMMNEANLNKIGIARNPQARKRQLELSSGLNIKIIKCWITLDASARVVEQYLHRMFARRRRNGEWFTHISESDVDYCGYELLECNFDGTKRRNPCG